MAPEANVCERPETPPNVEKAIASKTGWPAEPVAPPNWNHLVAILAGTRRIGVPARAAPLENFCAPPGNESEAG